MDNPTCESCKNITSRVACFDTERQWFCAIHDMEISPGTPCNECPDYDDGNGKRPVPEISATSPFDEMFDDDWTSSNLMGG